MINRKDLPDDFLQKLDSVKNKRARFVIDKIFEQGYCSTEDLKNAGYEHAPRAARDVRELGIPLETFSIKDSKNKKIAAYRFGDWEESKKRNQLSKVLGRTQLNAKLKAALIERYGAKCNLYEEAYSERLLQPDHRIPYEIGGDPENMMDLDYFMLLCPSANRDKSWACEHCFNWIEKEVEVCKRCYYAYPENYEHIAGVKEKRINLVFKGSDLKIFEAITLLAEENDVSKQEMIKRLIDISENLDRK